jgi:peptidoglycan hydrolase CwlO-like protein
MNEFSELTNEINEMVGRMKETSARVEDLEKELELMGLTTATAESRIIKIKKKIKTLNDEIRSDQEKLRARLANESTG